MSAKSKKGRNLGAVDAWLESIGLYRKNVAYDETCLFRAVSEQLFQTQIYHERVRKECVDYGRSNYYEFWDMLENEEEWYNHLDLLEKHMVFCGSLEIQLVSYKYQYDVILYDAVQQRANDATKRNLGRCIMLCQMNGDHYDAVYSKKHIQNAGFCQSIVYNVLYEKVFEVENVQDIVQNMLYKKEYSTPLSTEINNNSSCDDLKNKSGEVPSNMPPFPFKVAKALDPTIYRNIEYDTWTEVRREMRLGDWYYGDDNLILGTRCIFNSEGNTYECYIQEIIKNENKCVIYVTKLAQKMMVSYSDLSPEDDAKPWPLPYRFAKNLVVSTPTQSPEKVSKLAKKRKDKRRVKSSSESSVQSQVVNNCEVTEADIKAFIGAPLQMHSKSYDSYSPESPPEVIPETPQSQHNLLITPDVPSPAPKFSWDTPWTNYSQTTSSQVMWSHVASTNTPFSFQPSPMIASAPVTPDVIPYHGSRYPFVFNYHMDNYTQYTPWISSDYTPPNQEEEQEKVDPVEPSLYTDNYEPHMFEERSTLCSSLPSPQVEMFSPVVPIIYPHSPEIPELMLQPPPLQVFTPPVDVQYVPSGPFIYTPTPPTGWYPPGITAQGFTFPATLNQQGQ